jgi:hypothetical protein
MDVIKEQVNEYYNWESARAKTEYNTYTQDGGGAQNTANA